MKNLCLLLSYKKGRVYLGGKYVGKLGPKGVEEGDVSTWVGSVSKLEFPILFVGSMDEGNITLDYVLDRVSHGLPKEIELDLDVGASRRYTLTDGIVKMDGLDALCTLTLLKTDSEEA